MMKDALILDEGRTRYWVARSSDGMANTLEVKRTMAGYEIAKFDGDGLQMSLTLVDDLLAPYVDDGDDRGLCIVTPGPFAQTIRIPDRLLVETGLRPE